MTADSGEVECACRSTSMPSMLGILMSVMMTSYNAPSILRLAASPELTVTTMSPSRRSAMSSISQMERSSSQTRILAMRSPSCRSRAGNFRFPSCQGKHFLSCARRGRRPSSDTQAPEPQHKGGALSQAGARPNLAFVRLHDLVHNRQTQTGSTIKSGLEGLENFLRLLRAHAVSGVGKINLPVVSARLERDGERATVFHRTHGVLTEIPENLLELVAVGERQGCAHLEVALDMDAGLFGHHPILEQGKRIFEQGHEVDPVEAILLAARVGQEIGDDVIQAL